MISIAAFVALNVSLRKSVYTHRYLENKLYVVGHWYPVAICQREDFIIVQHGVEVFNPNSINRSVADDPLVL